MYAVVGDRLATAENFAVERIRGDRATPPSEHSAGQDCSDEAGLVPCEHERLPTLCLRGSTPIGSMQFRHRLSEMGQNQKSRLAMMRSA
jgi:hypothetical protein